MPTRNTLVEGTARLAAVEHQGSWWVGAMSRSVVAAARAHLFASTH
jgi:hypothetical protein